MYLHSYGVRERPVELTAGLAAEGQAVGTLYEATHLFAITCGRLSGFLVSVAAGVIAIATARSPGESRWLVGIAWIACIGGLAGNLLAAPGHPLMLASVGLMAAWQGFVYLQAAEAQSLELFRRSVTASVWMNGLMVAGVVQAYKLTFGATGPLKFSLLGAIGIATALGSSYLFEKLFISN